MAKFTLTDLEMIELENSFRIAKRDGGSWFTAEMSNRAADAIAELLARRERERERAEMSTTVRITFDAIEEIQKVLVERKAAVARLRDALRQIAGLPGVRSDMNVAAQIQTYVALCNAVRGIAEMALAETGLAETKEKNQ